MLEVSDAVGGRIRTDAVDGMLLDRGFQLLKIQGPLVSGRRAVRHLSGLR